MGRYLNIDPAHLTFAYESRGKPVLCLPDGMPPCRFNLSHSNGLVLIGATRQAALGVDVEYVRSVPEADQIAAKFFSGSIRGLENKCGATASELTLPRSSV